MRKLAWAAFGFAAAAFAAEYFLPVKGLPYIAAALFGLNILCIPLLRHGLRNQIFHRIFLFFLMASLGLIAWWGHYMLHILPTERLVGQEVTVSARLVDYPVSTDDYTRLVVRIIDGAPQEKAELTLYDDAIPAGMKPGDEITVPVTIRSALLRSGEKYYGYISKNHNLIGTMQAAPTLTGHWRLSWLYFPQKLASDVKNAISQLLSGDVSIFMTALMTGDSADLYEDCELYNSLRLSGVMHIVAVSGMHVSILAGSIQLVTGKRRRYSWICIAAVLLFVFMSGCRASVVRAAVMESFILLAPVLNRESDGITSLMAALLLLLILNPMAIGGIGLQLSFLCTLGYVILPPLLTGSSDPDSDRKPWKNRLRQSFVSTYCAGCFSVIPSAYYFDILSLVSPLANLLTLPIVSLIFAGGYTVCIVNLVFRPAAAILAKILALPAQWCLLVYRLLAKLPVSCLYRNQPAAIFIYAAVLVLLFFILLPWGKKIRKGKIGLGSICVLMLCGLILLQGRKLRASDGQLAVLDVGQGQCVILAEDSHAVVVGCGNLGAENAGDVAANFLLSEGVTQVDALILPQAEQSYADGAEMLMSRMDVASVILPGDHLAQYYSEIVSACANKDTPVTELLENQYFSVGEITCKLMYLEDDEMLAVSAEIADESVLIMSGADEVNELALLAGGWLDDTDILIAGGFGAENTSSKFFLDTIKPEIAVVSVGYNRYYLPDTDTMTRLRDCCGQVYRTDEEGSYILYF